MTLSLEKLKAVLETNNLIIKRIFTIDDSCVFIEVQILNETDIFLLYIPSKYTIPAPKSRLVFKISQMELTDSGYIPEEYTKPSDDSELEKKYSSFDINLNYDMNEKEDIESHLESNYDHPLSLRDLTTVDLQEIKSTLRQLKRLRLCVQHLKYKLSIVFKKYICCITRDNGIDGFIIRNFEGISEKKLFISIDLESFYLTQSSVKIDVKTIREGVYTILNKNQLMHTSKFEKIMEQKLIVKNYSQNIKIKKEQYKSSIKDLRSMLNDLNAAEKNKKLKLLTINSHYKNTQGLKGLQTDIEKTHKLAKIENQLNEIVLTKKEVLETLWILESKIENLSLNTDVLCFDSLVMLDSILKNFVKLKELQ